MGSCLCGDIETEDPGQEQNKSPDRNCHCDLWNVCPSLLVRQGLSRGFCGYCDTCGKLGHVRIVLVLPNNNNNNPQHQQQPHHTPFAVGACDACFNKQ